MSFASMKKGRGNFSDLQKKLEGDNKTSHKDERSYYPTLDEAGNGSAIIRFLPATDGDNDQPWIKVYSHGFKDVGGWYIEECPTTIGGECPLCEANSKLWSTGLDSDKEIARKRKRRLQYIANIMVIEDKKNPEFDGKVMLFKFGVKIFDKIKDSMFPEFDDESPVNVFDPWDGANFRLKIRKFEGMTNYDKSSFDAPTPLLGGDDKNIETVWKSQYKLTNEITADAYKSADILRKSFARATGSAIASASTMTTESIETPSAGETATPKQLQQADSETDDALDFLKNLAAE
jgi:hypothetical protein